MTWYAIVDRENDVVPRVRAMFESHDTALMVQSNAGAFARCLVLPLTRAQAEQTIANNGELL